MEFFDYNCSSVFIVDVQKHGAFVFVISNIKISKDFVMCQSYDVLPINSQSFDHDFVVMALTQDRQF